MTSSATRKKSSSNRLLILLVLLVLLIAIGALALLAGRPAASEQPLVEPPAEPPAVLQQPTVPPPAPGTDSLLAWVGSGAAPGQHSASAPGQLALVTSAGFAPLLDLPQGTGRVAGCGASPDGSRLAFYIGGDDGTLYLMTAAAAPARVDDVPALTCLGAGQALFSPDGARMGYIAYEPGAAQSEFADGNLRVVDTAALGRQFSAENVTAFAMTAEGVVYVSLFTNNRNEADEAAVTVWNGSTEREIATLTPTGEDCRFVSGQVAAGPNNRLVAVMGQRCKSGDTRSQWQLYVIDAAAGSATLAASDFQPGVFAPFARTNSIFFSPDGSRAFFTVPDGVTAYTAALKTVSLADLAVTNVIEKQAVLHNFSGAPNSFPLFSPNGRWLALVVTTPNNENTLNVVDLSNPTAAPLMLEAGSRGDIISAMAFSANGERLYVVAGGAGPADNSLFRLEIASGASSRVSRGRFGAALQALPGGALVALPEWQIPDDPREPAYLNTVIINTDTNEVSSWFAGADIVDGKVTNQRFAFPLAWRRS